MLKVELEKKLVEGEKYIDSLLIAIQQACIDASVAETRRVELEDVIIEVRNRSRQDQDALRSDVESAQKEAARLEEVIEDLKFDLNEGIEEAKAQREIFFKGLVSIKAASELTHECLNLNPLPRS